MSELPKYRDKREAFFKDFFNKAQTYEDYLNSGDENHASKWRSIAEQLSPEASFKKRLLSFKREMNILVMSGIWCGDCGRQGPMLRFIEENAPKMNFRYIDNKANPELQEELRLNGAEKVPVVVALSEDFFEVGRFGDRHLSVYRRKAENELGAACDPGIVGPSADELNAELSEWIDFFEQGQLMLRLAPSLRKRHGD